MRPEPTVNEGELGEDALKKDAETSEDILAAAPSAGSPRALSDRLPTPWLFPVLAFGAAWAIIAASWQVANAVYRTPWPWRDYFLFGDGSMYDWLAVHGYAGQHAVPPPPRAAYFPVLALLSKTVANMTWREYLPAEIIVEVVLGAASAVAVWALASHLSGHRTADRAVALYCAFPGAMTFGMLYPEPLANALAATSLLAVLNRKWLAAGLLALLASATHPAMLVLTPVLAIAAIQAISARREWSSLIAPVLAPLGAAGYFGLLANDYHDYFFWFHHQAGGWRQRADWIGHELRLLTWTGPGAGPNPFLHALLTVLAVVLIAGIAVMFAARLPLPVTLYTVLAAAALGMANQPGPTPRFAWTALGIFIAAGAMLPRWLLWPLLIISAALLAFLYGWWPHHPTAIAP